MASRNGSQARKREDHDTASDLEQLFGYNLKRAYIIFQTDFRKALGPDGLGPRSFALLALVVRFPNVTQSELARALGIERSGLVAIVDELEGRGYLHRVAVPGDRRVQALVATTEGSSAYADALQRVRDHETELLADFTDDEKKTLAHLLQKIRLREDD